MKFFWLYVWFLLIICKLGTEQLNSLEYGWGWPWRIYFCSGVYWFLCSKSMNCLIFPYNLTLVRYLYLLFLLVQLNQFIILTWHCSIFRSTPGVWYYACSKQCMMNMSRASSIVPRFIKHMIWSQSWLLNHSVKFYQRSSLLALYNHIKAMCICCLNVSSVSGFPLYAGLINTRWTVFFSSL